MQRDFARNDMMCNKIMNRVNSADYARNSGIQDLHKCIKTTKY